MKKNIIALIFAITIMTTTVFGAQTIVFVNNQSISNEYPPEIINGTTFLPIRPVTDALGYDITFDGATKTVYVGDVFKHTVGDTYITMADGEVKDIGIPSYIRNDKTYIPVRLFSEALDYDVNYDNVTKNIWITEKTPEVIVQPEVISYTDGFSEGLYKTVNSVDGKSEDDYNTSVKATNRNESAYIVKNNGKLSLTNMEINKTGSTTSLDGTTLKGLNSAVLVKDNGEVNMIKANITTNDIGSPAVFSDRGYLKVDSSNITTSNSDSNGIVVLEDSKFNINNSKIDTQGNMSKGIILNSTKPSKIATTEIKTSQSDSEALYLSGISELTDVVANTSNAVGAFIDGRAEVVFRNSKINAQNNYALFLAKTDDTNITSGNQDITMYGGTLSSNKTPAIYATNTDATILLEGVNISNGKDFMRIERGIYGESGKNGANVNLTLSKENIFGNIIVDGGSSLDLKLKNASYFLGAINNNETDAQISVDLEVDSTWDMNGDSKVDIINPTQKTLININSNGYTLYYDARDKANSWLRGEEKVLKGNGRLKPIYE